MHFKKLNDLFLVSMTVGLLSLSTGVLAKSLSLAKLSKIAFGSVLLLNNVVHPVQGINELCCLCDECGPPLEDRYGLLVDNSGTTCMDILFEMADDTNDSTPGSQACQNLYDKYHQTCCDPDFEPDVYTPAPTPGIEYVGPYPPCEVCLDGSRPNNPGMVIASLYWEGGVSCRQLYYHGKRGDFIQNHQCDAVQWFVQEPCGCTDDNKPTNRPTARPTVRPTLRPTLRPTIRPTVRGSAPTIRPVRKTPPANTMNSIGGSDGRGGAGGMNGFGGMRLLSN